MDNSPRFHGSLYDSLEPTGRRYHYRTTDYNSTVHYQRKDGLARWEEDENWRERSYRKKLTENELTITILKGQLSIARSQLTILEGRNSKNDLEWYGQNYSLPRQTNWRNFKRADEYETEVEDLIIYLEESEQEVADLRDNVEALERELDELQRENVRNKEKIHHLKQLNTPFLSVSRTAVFSPSGNYTSTLEERRSLSSVCSGNRSSNSNLLETYQPENNDLRKRLFEIQTHLHVERQKYSETRGEINKVNTRYENESKQLREDLKFRDRQIGRLQSEIKDLKKTRQDHENLTWKTDVNVQNEKQMKLESERQQKYIQHLEDELKLSKYDRIEGEVTEREKLETAKRELCDKSLEVADLKTRFEKEQEEWTKRIDELQRKLDESISQNEREGQSHRHEIDKMKFELTKKYCINCKENESLSRRNLDLVNKNLECTRRELDEVRRKSEEEERKWMKRNEELKRKLDELESQKESECQKLRREIEQTKSEPSKKHCINCDEIKARPRENLGSTRRELEEVTQRLLEENGRQRDEIGKLKSKISTLMSQREQIEQDVRKKADEIDNYRKQIEQIEFEIGEVDRKGSLENERRLKDMLEDTTRELKKSRQEVEDLITRLSKVMGQKLTDNNPNITDLSDKNRPTKLAERYSELYDNQWTDAFEVLHHGNEEDTIRTLRDILGKTMEFCVKESKKQMEQLRKTLVLTEGDTSLPGLVTKQIKDCRKTLAVTAGKHLYQQFLTTVRGTGNAVTQAAVSVPAFTRECFEVCWLMSVQDPPVVLSQDAHHGDAFNADVYKTYTRSGSTVEFVVWPAVYLCQGGGILCKGVAQGCVKK